MKTYKINPEIKRWIRRLLLNGMYSCRFHGNTCITNCPSNAFHRIVKRAYCDRKTEKTGILNVTFEESCSSGKLIYLLHNKHASAWQIADDNERLQALY